MLKLTLYICRNKANKARTTGIKLLLRKFPCVWKVINSVPILWIISELLVISNLNGKDTSTAVTKSVLKLLDVF